MVFAAQITVTTADPVAAIVTLAGVDRGALIACCGRGSAFVVATSIAARAFIVAIAASIAYRFAGRALVGKTIDRGSTVRNANGDGTTVLCKNSVGDGITL
jgi:hypothetical protein